MRGLLFWGGIFGSFPAIWRNPYWGVVLYGALNLIRPEILFWGDRSYNKAGFYVFAMTAFATLFKSKLDISSAKLQLFLLLWVGIALKVSIYFSEYQIERAHYYADEIWKILLFCVLLTILVNDDNKTKRLEDIFLGSMTFLGIWAIEQHFGGNERLESFGDMDSNGLAAMFVIFTPLAYNKLLHAQNKNQKLFGAVATMSLLLTIIFTQSRGGFLGLLMASIIWFKTVKQKAKTMLIVVFAFIAIIPFIRPEFVSRMQTINPGEGEMEGSASSRLILWQAGLMIFEDNPFLGTGFMTFPIAKMEYKGSFEQIDPEMYSELFEGTKLFVTHNTYIQLLSDGGLVLGVPFFLLLISTLWGNLKIKRKYSGTERDACNVALLQSIEAGILGYCTCIMFINAITFVFLPVQIIISSIIRKQIILERSRSFIPTNPGSKYQEVEKNG